MKKDNSDLSTSLEKLYSEQVEEGFISPTIVKQVRSLQVIPNTQNTHFFHLQFNPARAKRGIAEKQNPNPIHTIPYKDGVPCFLCQDNIQYQWPNEKWVSKNLNNRLFHFYPNPSPIFPHHFTVASHEHRGQSIDFSTNLHLLDILPNYWIIQNGEGAGATNPWHFHFQIFTTLKQLPLSVTPSLYSHSISLGDTTCILERLDLPLPVFKFQFKPSSPHKRYQGYSYIQEFLQSTLQHFYNIHPDNRINIITINRSLGTVDIYIALRNKGVRTDMYVSGQPGYAEIAGIVSTIRESDTKRWLQKGYGLYQQLLSDISIPESQYAPFEQSLLSLVE
ncbi:MAG: DUF4922 domain-containing protein [Candidatus Margulisbacteria bacterium]|nr:DUF4922 domain-containing protein [Candidatus Margulisiibacteriota bacterium]